MKQVLYWIGFRVASSQQVFIEDAFGLFNDVRMLTENDISRMASNFSSRTRANGRMNSGTRQIKYIKEFTYWVQYFYRISGLPSIVVLSEVTFKPQLYRAYTRSDNSKSMAKQTKISADAASPRPLENENQWKHGEEKIHLCQISHRGKRRTIIIRHTWEWGARYQRWTSWHYK